MAQTGFTPISNYYSTTASAVPTAANLVQGELAINTADGKLYYEDSSGVVQVLATKSTGSIGGSNTQVQFNNSGSLGGSSSFTWDGTTVTATKFAGALNGTVGATTASTGAFTTINASTSITNAGLTSGRVTYAGASGLLSDSAGLTYDGTNLTTTGTATATRFIPSGSTVATNGMYLPAANTLGFSTNSTNRATIDSLGNLSLGTTPINAGTLFGYKNYELPLAAFASFDVGTRPILQLKSNVYYDGAFATKYVSTGYATQYAQDSGEHIWSTAASGTAGNAVTLSTKMVLDASGNLLVGTTSGSFGGRVIVSNDGSATQTSLSCINTNGSGTMRQIDFFTGTNTSRVGSIESTTTLTAYNVSSDYRLKEDIAPMTGALAKIAQLKPVTYKWKINGSDGQGFIAHELAEVVPDCVSGEKDAVDANGNPDYQGVDTSFLIATLTSAIQEQQALIESLTTRLTALENK